MVQPSGMSRAQRRTANAEAPYGYNKKGDVRVVPRGTGAKKVFGLINIPLAIYNAVKTSKTKKQAIAFTAEQKARVQVPPHGSIGVD